jgi:ABC-type lipoprotein export system ATPase subunit
MGNKMSANLLFLYGPSGSGKTRLLQLIENLTIIASDLTCQDVVRSLPAVGDCLKQKDAVHLNMVQLVCQDDSVGGAKAW